MADRAPRLNSWTVRPPPFTPGGVTNPFDPGYYTSPELRAFGFARVGEHCMVARNCTIIGLANITLGDHVRIDGFSSLIAPNGRIRIGSWVHIATSCMLGARAGIDLGDFASLSQGVRLFTAIDDFSGRKLSNATVPEELAGIQAAPIKVGRHVPIGSGSMLLPGVSVGDGAAIGAMSRVVRSIAEWEIHAGNPAEKTGERARDLLALEEMLHRRQHLL
jgi:galactoside O-acetyltransferase